VDRERVSPATLKIKIELKMDKNKKMRPASEITMEKRRYSWNILLDEGWSSHVELIEQENGELTLSLGDNPNIVWSETELLQLRLVVNETLKIMAIWRKNKKH